METKGYMNIVKLPDWLAAHNILAKFKKPCQNGKIYLPDTFPFSSAHKDGAYAIRFGDGGLWMEGSQVVIGSGPV